MACEHSVDFDQGIIQNAGPAIKSVFFDRENAAFEPFWPLASPMIDGVHVFLHSWGLSMNVGDDDGQPTMPGSGRVLEGADAILCDQFVTVSAAMLSSVVILPPLRCLLTKGEKRLRLNRVFAVFDLNVERPEINPMIVIAGIDIRTSVDARTIQAGIRDVHDNSAEACLTARSESCRYRATM